MQRREDATPRRVGKAGSRCARWAASGSRHASGWPKLLQVFNRPCLFFLLCASALLIGCGASEPAAAEAASSEPAVQEQAALVEPFVVNLNFPAEGDDPFKAHSIVNGPTANLSKLESHFSVLQGGKSSHAPHKHPAEEIIFPIEGDVEIYRGPWEDTAESRERIGPGQFVFHASNHIHAMSAIGPDPSRYWVMQWAGGPTGAAEDILPPTTLDYRKVPAIDKASGVGRAVLIDSQTPNVGRLQMQSVALASGAAIKPAAQDYDTVLITLSDGIKIGGKDLAAHTVAFYPAGDEFGVENTGTDAARYVTFEYSK